MDRLLEYYLFNPQDQLKLEFKQVEGQSGKQLTISEQLHNESRNIGTHHSSKRLSSNDLENNQNSKSRNKQFQFRKLESLQQKQTQMPLQQKKQSAIFEDKNTFAIGDYKSGNPKNKSQSYSQTLRNYKLISLIPQNNMTPSNQNLDLISPQDRGYVQESYYNTPINSKKDSISGVKSGGRLSNSAVFSYHNLPFTPHQRVMRIKNKQINIAVQNQYNNLIIDSQNNFFGSNLDSYYRQADQNKHTSISHEDMAPNTSSVQEQNIKNQQIKADQNQLDHINLYLNQKTPESLYTVATPLNKYNFDSPQSRNVEQIQQNFQKFGNKIDQNLSPNLTSQKDDIFSTPNSQNNQKLSQLIIEPEKIRLDGGESRKSSGIQNHISLRVSKRGSNFNGRIVSPVVYNVENIEKSPIQNGTWSHSFYKHTSGVHKQMKKQLQKKEKANDFEEYLRNELAQTQIPNLDKLDIPNIVSNKSYLQIQEEIAITTPQSLTYHVHRSKDSYKPLQISKAFREQYKNISQLLSTDQELSPTPLNTQNSIRNKSLLQQKNKIQNPRLSVSNMSNRLNTGKSQQQQQKQAQILEFKQTTSEDINNEIQRATFSTNFPIQKHNEEFRFSKQNIKRKNHSPKKNIFKI